MVVFIAAIFGCLAALMAYLITYNEYAHHFNDKREVIKTAVKTAIITFIFFLGLGLVLAIVLPRIIN